MSTKPASFVQRGISLIELIMFIVIVSSAMAGILLVMNQVTRHSADPLIQKQALAIAESMLEEIQLQDVNPASCTGALGPNAVRTNASCVTVYGAYSSTGIHEFTAANALVPGLENYNITAVLVTAVSPFGGTAINPAIGAAYQIDVTVTHVPTATTVVATGYRAGPL